MNGRRAKRGAWLMGLALVGLVVAGGLTRGPELLGRAQRRLALGRAIAALDREARAGHQTPEGHWNYEAEEALVGLEDPEALLALLRSFRAARKDPERDTADLLAAVELFALEPEPRDLRVREGLEAIAREESVEKRAWALYFLDELEHPRHAREPEGFAAPGARVRATWPDALEVVRAVATLPIEDLPGMPSHPDASGMRPGRVLEDTPWRALVRIAQPLGKRVEVAQGRVRLVPARAVESVSEERSHPPADHNFKTSVRVYDGVDDEEWVIYPVPPLVPDWAPLGSFRGGLHGCDPEASLRAVARASGLEVRHATDRQLVPFAPDRAAFLARLVAVCRGRVGADLPDETVRKDRWALLAFDEPEAFAALLESYTAAETDPSEEMVLEAGCLFAATSAPDARVRAQLSALARSEDPVRRFVGLSLEDELREPSFPRTPPELARRPLVVIASGGQPEVVAALASSTGVPIVAKGALTPTETGPPFVAPCWRAILRLAGLVGDGRARWDVSFSRGTVTLEPHARDRFDVAWDGPERVPGVGEQTLDVIRREHAFGLARDKRRALRVLAEMQGCELRESPSGQLSFEKKPEK